MNCPENQYKKYTHPTPGGPGRGSRAGGGVWGHNFKSAGNFTNCRENRYKSFRGDNLKVTKHQFLKSVSGMHLSWAKPGNPREGRRQGRIGERGRGEGGGERVPSEAG